MAAPAEEESQNFNLCTAGLLLVYCVCCCAYLLCWYGAMSQTPEFFAAERMIKNCLLNSDLYPQDMLAVFIVTMGLASWAIILSCKQHYASPNVLAAFKICSVVASIFVLMFLILEMFYLHEVHSGEADAKKILGHEMRMQMRQEDPADASTISRAWSHTQRYFECCGVDSYADWFFISLPFVNKAHSRVIHGRVLPASCCTDDAEYCFNPETWRRNGCLQEQINFIQRKTFCNFMLLLFLYLLLLLLVYNISTYFDKYPPIYEYNCNYSSDERIKNRKKAWPESEPLKKRPIQTQASKPINVSRYHDLEKQYRPAYTTPTFQPSRQQLPPIRSPDISIPETFRPPPVPTKSRGVTEQQLQSAAKMYASLAALPSQSNTKPEVINTPSGGTVVLKSRSEPVVSVPSRSRAQDSFNRFPPLPLQPVSSR